MKRPSSLISALLLVATLITCQRTETGDVIFSNVNVIDVVNGVVIETQDVIIEGNTVKWILDHGSTKLETGQLIDGTGKYLIPGLWDMHVHLRARKLSPELRKMLNVKMNDLDVMIAENKDLLPLFIAHGVTSVHEMGSDIIDSLLVWRDQTRSGRLIGPNLYLTGPKIEGAGFPFYANSIIIEDDEDIQKAVAQMLNWEVDGVKIMGGVIEPALYHRAIEEMEKAGLRTYTHNLELFSARDFSGLGVDAIAHMRGANFENFKSYESWVAGMKEKETFPPNPDYPGDFWELLLNEYDPKMLQETLRQLAENGTALISTLYYREYDTEPEKFEEVFYEPLKYVGTNLRENIESQIKRFKGASESNMVYRRKLHGTTLEMLSHLPQSGITLLVGTDSGYGNRAPGTNYYYELELLASSGLSNANVLKAATWNAAQFMGKEDAEGSVAKGKVADLVLLENNPLEDIRNVRNIQGVMRNGTWLDRDQLDQMLHELEMKY